MTGPGASAPTAARQPRRYGPDVGEPPPLADPRRWGGVIGLVGGLVFVGTGTPALGAAASVVGWAVGGALALAALFAHCVRPVALGPLARPRPLGLAVYAACVVGQVALIAVGTRALASAGQGGLQPALVTTVVGLHFLPMAWAFTERMFLVLGGAVAVLGAVGLASGAAGVPRAADALSVLAGLVMLLVVALHAHGRLSVRAPGATGSSRLVA